MKAAFLATGIFDKGGISRYGRYQIRALREVLDGRVRAFSLLGHSTNDFEEPFHVEYHGGTASLLNKTRFSWNVFKTFLSWRPSIVWCNHLHLLPLALALKAFVPGAKVLVNVYGLELWTDRQWLHRKTLPGCSLVVADCYFSARYVVEQYGLPENRVRVVWDCVDTKRFQPSARRNDLLAAYGVPVGREYRYILSLGRIVKGAEHKGYDRLIDCMGHLRNHRNFILLFAGDGNDRPRLENRVREARLSDRIFFLGSVQEDQLVDVYNLCDLFVHVSDRGHGRGEGIPLTPLEAAACGKAILVGNEDGSQEAVVDEVNGRIVSPRSQELMSQAIRELLLNDEMRARMGKGARSRAAEEFSYERFRGQIAKILEEFRSGGSTFLN
jgi:phosphatidylinositol alpha-1,6-mannosyltransferase